MVSGQDSPRHEGSLAIPNQKLGEFMHDPVLLEMAQELVSSTGEVINQLAELVDSEPSTGQETSILDQTLVDEVARSMIDETAMGATMTASRLFAELEKRKTKSGGSANLTSLEDGLAVLVYAEPRNRTENRFGRTPLTKCRELVEYWTQTSPVLTPEQVGRINHELFEPIAQFVTRRKEAFGAKPIEMAALKEILASCEKIDPSTDLSTIKLLVFSTMVDIFKQDDILSAHRRIYDEESVSSICESPCGPYYWAADYLGKLKEESSEKAKVRLDLLTRMHTETRFLHLPNRKFTATIKRLSFLGTTYRRLDFIERQLKNIPDHTHTSRDLLKIITASNVDKLVVAAVNTQRKCFRKMAEVMNQRLAQAADNETRLGIWEEAERFDELIVDVAEGLLAYLEEPGIKMDPATKHALQENCKPRVRDMINRRVQEHEAIQVKQEIDDVLGKLRSIDEQYVLPNKRFRERTPQLINLAKVLSDSLNDHEPMAEQDARALVGLMLGVYWERTGVAASAEELAEQYLSDAKQLRELTTKLESLGHSEDSQLLKLMNLLDEMVDSGLFDDTEKHPEFELFEDFVLAYIIAKDKGEPPKSTEGPDGNDETIDAPALPVETIRQAVYEDIKVFPPSSNATDVIKDYVANIEAKDMPSIEWERIKKLIELRNQFVKQNLNVQLIRTKHASWQVLPFFVLEIKLPDSEYGVAIVESPVYGNATYVYREASDRLTWRDVVQLERQEARAWGAVPAVHVDSKRLDIHFRKLWNRVISELTIFQ